MNKASKIKKFCSILGLLTISSLVSAAPSLAQKFTVSPMVTINQVRGGQSKGSISITNDGTEPLRVRAYAEDFVYDRSRGFTIIKAHDRSIIPYLQFSPRELVIPPGVTRSVRVMTTLPSNLADGEYRGVVFVEDLKEKPVTTTNGNQMSISARIASVFFISKGNTGTELQVNGAVWDNSNKKLKILIANKGSRSATSNTEWRITKDGQEVAKYKQPLAALVQAGGEREMLLPNVSLSSGKYNLSGNISNPSDKKVTPFNLEIVVP